MKTQTESILEYLQAGNKLTPLEALNKFGCFRLGARIWDIKHLGHDIKSELIKVNNKYVSQYSMEIVEIKNPDIAIGAMPNKKEEILTLF
jgi:hypothetical protein